MPTPRPWPARIRSAACGAAFGCLLGGAILHFQNSAAPADAPRIAVESDVARPGSLTATSPRGQRAGVEKDVAAAMAILEEHPDALLLSREGAIRLLGNRLFQSWNLRIMREGSNPLQLSDGEMNAVNGIIEEAHGKVQALEAASARLVSKSEEEMVFEIPANGAERDKLFREFRRDVQKLVGPLRGDLIAGIQETQWMLGRTMDDRTYAFRRPANQSLSYSLSGASTSHSAGAGSTWAMNNSASLEHYPELIPTFGHLVDFETWNEREGIPRK